MILEAIRPPDVTAQAAVSEAFGLVWSLASSYGGGQGPRPRSRWSPGARITEPLPSLVMSLAKPTRYRRLATSFNGAGLILHLAGWTAAERIAVPAPAFLLCRFIGSRGRALRLSRATEQP